MAKKKLSKTQAAYAAGYLSGFEKDIGDELAKLAKEYTFKYKYEADRLNYTKPVTSHTYTPDWWVWLDNGDLVIIETKGYFTAQDRKKHVLIKEQHPELDIRILFQRDNPIRKGSKTKYSDWCIKQGIKFAIGKTIPQEWIEEWFLKE